MKARAKPTAQDLAQRLTERANRLRDHGKLKEAEALYRKALGLRKKVLGPEHADIAQSMNFLANLLEERGRHAKAELFYRESLKLRKKSSAVSIATWHPA